MPDVISLLIAFIVVAGICAIAYIIVKYALGIVIPDWVVKIAWIIVAVFVGVIAIRFLAGLLW